MRSTRYLIALLAVAPCLGCSALPWEQKPSAEAMPRSVTANLLDLEVERNLAASRLVQTELALASYMGQPGYTDQPAQRSGQPLVEQDINRLAQVRNAPSPPANSYALPPVAAERNRENPARAPHLLVDYANSESTSDTDRRQRALQVASLLTQLVREDNPGVVQQRRDVPSRTASAAGPSPTLAMATRPESRPPAGPSPTAASPTSASPTSASPTSASPTSASPAAASPAAASPAAPSPGTNSSATDLGSGQTRPIATRPLQPAPADLPALVNQLESLARRLDATDARSPSSSAPALHREDNNARAQADQAELAELRVILQSLLQQLDHPSAPAPTWPARQASAATAPGYPVTSATAGGDFQRSRHSQPAELPELRQTLVQLAGHLQQQLQRLDAAENLAGPDSERQQTTTDSTTTVPTPSVRPVDPASFTRLPRIAEPLDDGD